ncbi:MAG: hypothetical protein GY696_24980 [Gammaproteobacteria bacterium]|nr:hypothetical protein [Gammaproteobacteria bacterium]
MAHLSRFDCINNKVNYSSVFCFTAQCSLFDNTDYQDNNLSPVPFRSNVDSAGDCCALCYTENRCAAFTWNKNNHNCYLKSGKTAENVDPEGVSGLKGNLSST